MRAFACPVCDSFAPFESRRCPTCHAELRLHVPTLSMIATTEGAADIDGSRWIECTKSASLGCNWMVPETQDAARAWNAQTAPHLYVLDAEGLIRYEGAPDADHMDPTLRAEWLRAALDSVLAGEAPKRESSDPVGCSIKWK